MSTPAPQDGFAASFAWVAGAEGGFSDDPDDPGNWTGGSIGQGALHGTRWGISAAAFPDLDLATLTEPAARQIYHDRYWCPAGCPDLAAPLGLLMLDAAVNAGVTRAVIWLQEALGITADGCFGPETAAAARAASLDVAGADMLARRINATARLPGWACFGLGWARRFARLALHAASLNASAAAPATK